MRRLVLLLLLVSLALARGEPAGQFLVLSDLHYNPFQTEGFPRRGQDSTRELIESALDQARQRCPHPRFILLTGDLLAHKWEDLYAASHEDPTRFREFTGETVAWLAREIERRWPDTPVLPVPGNEDSFEGNYQVQPGGPFLEKFSQIWAPLTRARAATEATLREGGFCSMAMPGDPDRQLIGLNTVFFSANRMGLDDGKQELEWLEEELSRLEREHRRAWLVMHIPPGLDNYHTALAFNAGQPDPVELWRTTYQEQFVALLERHPGTVEAAVAGHTHRDDFRLLAPSLPCKIVPAISPVYGNNPGFGVFRTDWSDYDIYYNDLSGPEWQREYSFREAYGLDRLDLVRLDTMLQPGSVKAGLYQRFYSVSGPGEITDQNLEVYRWSMLHLQGRPAETLKL